MSEVETEAKIAPLSAAEEVSYPLLFAAGCAALLLFGVVMTVLGVMFGLPAVRAQLHINFAQQGQLFLLLFLGMLVSDLLAGTLSDRFGRKLVLSAACLLVALALAGLALADSFRSAGWPIFVLGIGGGALNVAANALVSDVAAGRRGAAMNHAGAFFGVGALLVPAAFVGVEGVLRPAQVLLGTAGICVAGCVFFLSLRFPRPAHKSGFSLLQSLRVARYPGFWALMLLLLFQAGNEAAVGGWTSSFAGAAGLSPRAATAVLASMWVAVIAARGLAGFLVARLGKHNTIIVSALGGVVGCALLLSAHSLAMLALGAVVVGLAFAPIFQTGLSIAADRYPREAGSVFGLLFASAVPGCMVWPWALGEVAQRYGLRLAMWIPLLGMCGVCVLAVVMRRVLPAGDERQGSAH